MSASNTTTATKAKGYHAIKTDPRTDEKVREKLVTARIALLLKAPFFGNLATRMQLINADDWCPTAATDGKRFYYNSDFVNKMPLKQVEFLVGHEVLHAVYDHMGRRGDRDPKIWNIADDFCVNADLVEHHVGELDQNRKRMFEGMHLQKFIEKIVKTVKIVPSQELALIAGQLKYYLIRQKNRVEGCVASQNLGWS